MDEGALDIFVKTIKAFLNDAASAGVDLQTYLHLQFPLPSVQEEKFDPPTVDGSETDLQCGDQRDVLHIITQSRSPLNIVLLPAINLANKKKETAHYARSVLETLERDGLIERLSFRVQIQGQRETTLIAWKITAIGRKLLGPDFRPSDLDELKRLSITEAVPTFYYLILAYHTRLRAGRVIFASSLTDGYGMSIGYGPARYRVVMPVASDDALMRLQQNPSNERIGACAANLAELLLLIDRLHQSGLSGATTTIEQLRATQNDASSPLWTGTF